MEQTTEGKAEEGPLSQPATGAIVVTSNPSILSRGGSVVVEAQPRILSERATGSGVGALEGGLMDAGDRPVAEGMDLGEQRPAVISLVLQSDSGRIPSSQSNTTSVLPSSSLAGVGKGVLDDGETLESVRFVEGSPSNLLHCKDVEDTVVTDGPAIQLEDGTTAYIHQVSADKFSSIEDGQTVQLEDGSTAYILRASLKVPESERPNLQAVQLEDGTTALLQTNFNGSSHDDSESGSLGVLDPFSGGTDGVSQSATIHVSGTSSLTPTSGSTLRLKTNEAGALTIKAVAPSTNVFGKEFLCTYSGCGRNYTSAHHLKVHVRSHTGERPFPCTHCEKAFATSYGLKSHTRVHTGEKPYRCPFANCAKAFKTSGDLQKHIRTHTGERPFKCPFEGCEKSFTTSNIRKVHIRTHTGERPYVCQEPLCDRAFSSATNYKNHMRIHSGEKPYVCTVSGCGKRFTEYSSLYKHHVVHTYSKPYTCVICGKNYRQTSTLSLHRRTAHGLYDDEISPTQVPRGTIITAGGDKEPQRVVLQIRGQPEANTILASTTAPSSGTSATPPIVADYVTVLSDPSVQAVTTTSSEDVILNTSTTTVSSSADPVPSSEVTPSAESLDDNS